MTVLTTVGVQTEAHLPADDPAVAAQARICHTTACLGPSCHARTWSAGATAGGTTRCRDALPAGVPVRKERSVGTPAGAPSAQAQLEPRAAATIRRVGGADQRPGRDGEPGGRSGPLGEGGGRQWALTSCNRVSSWAGMN